MGPGQTCPQSSSCASLVSSGTTDLTHSKSNLMLFSLTVISPARQEHRCLVTDELYSFPVTSRHRAETIPMAFPLVTFILPSRRVAGHACGGICFLSSMERRLQTHVQASGGCKEAETKETPSKASRWFMHMWCVPLGRMPRD